MAFIFWCKSPFVTARSRFLQLRVAKQRFPLKICAPKAFMFWCNIFANCTATPRKKLNCILVYMYTIKIAVKARVLYRLSGNRHRGRSNCLAREVSISRRRSIRRHIERASAYRGFATANLYRRANGATSPSCRESRPAKSSIVYLYTCIQSKSG